MWLINFKKSLILKDFDTLAHLIDEMPHFESLLEMEEATYLLHHTKTLLELEQSTIFTSLQQLKANIDFLKVTENTPTSSINFKL